MAKSMTLDEVGELLQHVVAHMATKEETATKDDLANLRKEVATKSDILKLHEQLTSIEAELRSINRRLDALEDAVGNLTGFANEVVDLRNRLETIEQHLGLDRKIAA